jgi:transposase-like protein
MRYSASAKLEIIEPVEQSSLSVRRTLTPIGVPRSAFYAWYDRYQEGGIDALEYHKPRPKRVWNKIPDDIIQAILDADVLARFAPCATERTGNIRLCHLYVARVILEHCRITMMKRGQR